MSYQLSRLDLVVNNATTKITVNTNPSTQDYINGDITPQNNVITIATTVNRFTNPDDYPAATVKSTSKAASLTDLTATEVGTINIPISATVEGNGLKNLITSYYEGITYTPQLLTCVGVNDTSTTIQDLSSNNFTITNNNAATVSSFAPFLNSYPYASLLFNGTNQSLTTTVAAGSSLDLADGAGDWTIEGWFYLTSLPASASVVWKSAGSNPSYGLFIAAGVPQWIVGNGTSGGVPFNLAAVTANTWYHFALTRAGNALTPYMNGVAQTGATMSFIMGNGAGTTLYVGAANDGRYFPGYISNVRIVKGAALYRGNFLPPTINFSSASVTTITTKVSATTTAYTKLTYLPLNINLYNSLKYTAPTGQTEVYDHALTVNSYTAAATTNINVISSTKTMNVVSRPDFYITGSDAPIVLSTEGRNELPSSNTTTVTAAGSLRFDGYTSFIKYPYTTAYTFGSVDFTVECWFNQTARTSPNAGLMGLYKTFTGRAWIIYITPDGTPTVSITNNTGLSGGTVTLNTWNHVAFVRNGANSYLYVNGTQVSTAAIGTIAASVDPLIIGASNDSASPVWFFNGYITNVRVVKGTAVYTSNFTPTVPLTAVANTQLLLLTSSGGPTVDSSTNQFLAATPTLYWPTYTSAVKPSITTANTATNYSPLAYVSTPNNQAYIRNTTKYNDPTQVEGYFNSFIPEHTGEEDRVQAWV